jgi:hypothetical protein
MLRNSRWHSRILSLLRQSCVMAGIGTLSLTTLTDEACSIRKFTASLSSETLTLVDNQLVKVSPSLDSNDELNMKLGPWLEASRRFVSMLRRCLNAGTPQNVKAIADAWEAHFLQIQAWPNLQFDFGEIWLPYDMTLRKTFIIPGQTFNPAVVQDNILSAVECDSIKCQTSETRRMVQSMMGSSAKTKPTPSSQPSSLGNRPQPTRKNVPTKPESSTKWCFLCKSPEHGAKQCKAPIYLILHKGQWAKPDGTQICYPFNGISGCPNAPGACTYEHACSLCGQAHRARDCKA